MAQDKPLKRYRLCRRVTFLEYDERNATSLAEAKRIAFPRQSTERKYTHWHMLGEPVVL